MRLGRMSDKTLSTETKSWLDNVLIPAMVREYLEKLRAEKQLASEEEVVAECAPKRIAASGRDE